MALSPLREEEFLLRRDFIGSPSNTTLMPAVEAALREAVGLPELRIRPTTPMMSPHGFLLGDGVSYTVLIKLHRVTHQNLKDIRAAKIDYSMVVQCSGEAVWWTGDLDDDATHYRREPPRLLLFNSLGGLPLTPALRKTLKALIPQTP